jgi:hypothetical protein
MFHKFYLSSVSPICKARKRESLRMTTREAEVQARGPPRA